MKNVWILIYVSFCVCLEYAFFLSSLDAGDSSVRCRVQMTNADAERRKRLRKRHFDDRAKERAQWVRKLIMYGLLCPYVRSDQHLVLVVLVV